jgi:hypothetical protein
MLLNVRHWHIAAALAVLLWGAAASAQLSHSVIEPGHPAIRYGEPAADRVAALNRRLAADDARLDFSPRAGYLPSLLAALDVPIDSQIAVFSRTSLQSPLINSHNPRTIFFNDSVAVAWMAGGFIEVAALDPRQGAVFYELPQTPVPTPQLRRDMRCLTCHYSTATLGVPGYLVRSIPSAIDGMILPWLGNYTTDHRSPLEERWGGWYVTGRSGGRHLGNAPIVDRTAQDVRIDDSNLDVATLADRFDTGRYLSPLSDIVAHLVFEHQMRMSNLLTRLGWEVRIAEHERRPDAAAALDRAAVEVVDYLLFVDEAPLDGVRGTSGFAERFSALGPRDGKGRSLRDLDLDRRLLRYPCSYMIYSEAFDALAPAAKDAVYRRMWRVLSGADSSAKYARLSASDRQAIVEILRETKRDLPPWFGAVRTVSVSRTPA